MSSFTASGQARNIEYQGHRYAIYSADYPTDKIALYWKNANDEKLRNFGSLIRHVAAGGHKLLFATNAGMYTPDNTPCGLYIENGIQLRRIILGAKGQGNFFMQPNGVFLLTKTEARVVTSQEFSHYKDKAIYATQSGPMLVDNGAINNNFTKGSANVYVRSGVGIDKKGRVVFAISEGTVNFHDFASLFKEDLNCNNALYLDGAISRMYERQLNLNDTGGNFGAMIGIVK